MFCGTIRGIVRILPILSLLALAWLNPTLARSETLHLTEDRVLEMALENNLGIKIAKTESEIGKTGIQSAKSVFDTLLTANIDHTLDKSDQPSTIFGTKTRRTNFNLGVSKLIPSGTRAKLEWLNQRNSTNSVFATINPFYESALILSLEQPLLNNIFGKQDRGRVSAARKIYEATDFLSQRQILQETFAVLSHYWRWVADRAIVSVTRRSVYQAKKFEDISKQKEEFGLHESTDVLASKANRLQMENLLIDAKKSRDNSLGRLRRGLNLDKDIRLASDQRVPFSRDSPELDESLTIAIKHRSDYLAAKSLLDARKIELALAKNRRWPELDLVASLQLNGINTAYGTSLEEVGGGDHPTYFIGGQFSFPLENRRARSDTQRAELEKAKILYQLKDLENKISQNVEEQWREVRSWIKHVTKNRRIEYLQGKKLEEELKKYRTGRSSSDTVVRFQEDYLNAQRITLNSLFSYRMAVLGLRLAQNTLIQ